MADYISRDDAVCIADYAVDEHPYDKDRARPETYSDYNQGWDDACNYIQGKLETAKPADAEPVRHGRWVDIWGSYTCSECEYMWEDLRYKTPFCPECGCKMDLEGENASDRF